MKERHVRKSLELALEKARYEAGRAQRQFDAVDPANRLVAGELESRWNQALRRVHAVERQLSELDERHVPLTDEQKESLLDLGSDVRSLWNHPATPVELKKRLLRTVIHEIMINLDEERRHVVLVIHWQGGVHTEIRVPRNGPGQRQQITDRDAIELIRELSKVCNDQTIAATLNRLGYRTGAGKSWRVHSVYNARYYHRLPNYRNGKDWLTIHQAAAELGVSHTVIRRLIRQKKLPASQVVDRAPWIIDREDLTLPIVQAEVNAVRRGRQLPRTDPQQRELFPK